MSVPLPYCLHHRFSSPRSIFARFTHFQPRIISISRILFTFQKSHRICLALVMAQRLTCVFVCHACVIDLPSDGPDIWCVLSAYGLRFPSHFTLCVCVLGWCIWLFQFDTHRINFNLHVNRWCLSILPLVIWPGRWLFGFWWVDQVAVCSAWCGWLVSTEQRKMTLVKLKLNIWMRWKWLNDKPSSSSSSF